MEIRPGPYGVVLVIGAWNYPLVLTLEPLIAAIAAGNCAIVKPSEVVPAFAKLVEEQLGKYLDTKCFHVYNGGAAETTALLGSQLVPYQVNKFGNFTLYFRATFRLHILHWEHRSGQDYLCCRCQVSDSSYSGIGW